MFEKLLSLLLHAKGGAVATVFVLGTTGALVTATVDAGVTTLTITQPSSTTTGSETTTPGGTTTTTTNTTVTETILALFNRTKTEEGPTETATGNGCSDEAHRINTLVKEINAEFKLAHQAVATLSKAASTDDAKKAAKDADKTLKDARREAVKEIHATRDCPMGDDEDVDEDEDADEDEDTAATGTSVAFSGTDPEAIADLAISAMKQVVTDLTAKLAAQATTTNTTTTSDKAKPEGKSNKNDNKGKGNGKGRSGDDEDAD